MVVNKRSRKKAPAASRRPGREQRAQPDSSSCGSPDSGVESCSAKGTATKKKSPTESASSTKSSVSLKGFPSKTTNSVRQLSRLAKPKWVEKDGSLILKTETKLSEEDRAGLQRSWPEFGWNSNSFGRKIVDHPRAAVERDVSGFFSKHRNRMKKVIDLGGNPVQSVSAGFENVHVCRMVENARDQTRAREADSRVQRIINGKIKNGQPLFASEMAYQKNPRAVCCDLNVLECNQRADIIIANHVYDLDVYEVIRAMQRHRCAAAELWMILHPGMLTGQTCVVAEQNMRIVPDPATDTVRYHFLGETTNGYVHRLSGILSFMTRTLVTVGLHQYVIEFKGPRSGVYQISVKETDVPIKGISEQIPRFWATETENAKNIAVLLSRRDETGKSCQRTLIEWLFDAPAQRQTYEIAVLPRALYDNTFACAYRKVQALYDPKAKIWRDVGGDTIDELVEMTALSKAVVSYAHSYNHRVDVCGTTVTVPHSYDMDLIRKLCVHIVVRAKFAVIEDHEDMVEMQKVMANRKKVAQTPTAVLMVENLWNRIFGEKAPIEWSDLTPTPAMTGFRRAVLEGVPNYHGMELTHCHPEYLLYEDYVKLGMVGMCRQFPQLAHSVFGSNGVPPDVEEFSELLKEEMEQETPRTSHNAQYQPFRNDQDDRRCSNLRGTMPLLGAISRSRSCFSQWKLDVDIATWNRRNLPLPVVEYLNSRPISEQLRVLNKCLDVEEGRKSRKDDSDKKLVVTVFPSLADLVPIEQFAEKAKPVILRPWMTKKSEELTDEVHAKVLEFQKTFSRAKESADKCERDVKNFTVDFKNGIENDWNDVMKNWKEIKETAGVVDALTAVRDRFGTEGTFWKKEIPVVEMDAIHSAMARLGWPGVMKWSDEVLGLMKREEKTQAPDGADRLKGEEATHKATDASSRPAAVDRKKGEEVTQKAKDTSSRPATLSPADFSLAHKLDLAILEVSKETELMKKIGRGEMKLTEKLKKEMLTALVKATTEKEIGEIFVSHLGTHRKSANTLTAWKKWAKEIVSELPGVVFRSEDVVTGIDRHRFEMEYRHDDMMSYFEKIVEEGAMQKFEKWLKTEGWSRHSNLHDDEGKLKPIVLPARIPVRSGTIVQLGSKLVAAGGAFGNSLVADTMVAIPYRALMELKDLVTRMPNSAVEKVVEFKMEMKHHLLDGQRLVDERIRAKLLEEQVKKKKVGKDKAAAFKIRHPVLAEALDLAKAPRKKIAFSDPRLTALSRFNVMPSYFGTKTPVTNLLKDFIYRTDVENIKVQEEDFVSSVGKGMIPLQVRLPPPVVSVPDVGPVVVAKPETIEDDQESIETDGSLQSGLVGAGPEARKHLDVLYRSLNLTKMRSPTKKVEVYATSLEAIRDLIGGGNDDKRGDYIDKVDDVMFSFFYEDAEDPDVPEVADPVFVALQNAARLDLWKPVLSWKDMVENTPLNEEQLKDLEISMHLLGSRPSWSEIMSRLVSFGIGFAVFHGNALITLNGHVAVIVMQVQGGVLMVASPDGAPAVRPTVAEWAHLDQWNWYCKLKKLLGIVFEGLRTIDKVERTGGRYVRQRMRKGLGLCGTTMDKSSLIHPGETTEQGKKFSELYVEIPAQQSAAPRNSEELAAAQSLLRHTMTTGTGKESDARRMSQAPYRVPLQVAVGISGRRFVDSRGVEMDVWDLQQERSKTGQPGLKMFQAEDDVLPYLFDLRILDCDWTPADDSCRPEKYKKANHCAVDALYHATDRKYRWEDLYELFRYSSGVEMEKAKSDFSVSCLLQVAAMMDIRIMIVVDQQVTNEGKRSRMIYLNEPHDRTTPRVHIKLSRYHYHYHPQLHRCPRMLPDPSNYSVGVITVSANPALAAFMLHFEIDVCDVPLDYRFYESIPVRRRLFVRGDDTDYPVYYATMCIDGGFPADRNMPKYLLSMFPEGADPFAFRQVARQSGGRETPEREVVMSAYGSDGENFVPKSPPMPRSRKPTEESIEEEEEPFIPQSPVMRDNDETEESPRSPVMNDQNGENGTSTNQNNGNAGFRFRFENADGRAALLNRPVADVWLDIPREILDAGRQGRPELRRQDAIDEDMSSGEIDIGTAPPEGPDDDQSEGDETGDDVPSEEFDRVSASSAGSNVAEESDEDENDREVGNAMRAVIPAPVLDETDPEQLVRNLVRFEDEKAVQEVMNDLMTQIGSPNCLTAPDDDFVGVDVTDEDDEIDAKNVAAYWVSADPDLQLCAVDAIFAGLRMRIPRPTILERLRHYQNLLNFDLQHTFDVAAVMLTVTHFGYNCVVYHFEEREQNWKTYLIGGRGGVVLALFGDHYYHSPTEEPVTGAVRLGDSDHRIHGVLAYPRPRGPAAWDSLLEQMAGVLFPSGAGRTDRYFAPQGPSKIDKAQDRHIDKLDREVESIKNRQKFETHDPHYWLEFERAYQLVARPGMPNPTEYRYRGIRKIISDSIAVSADELPWDLLNARYGKTQGYSRERLKMQIGHVSEYRDYLLAENRAMVSMMATIWDAITANVGGKVNLTVAGAWVYSDSLKILQRIGQDEYDCYFHGGDQCENPEYDVAWDGENFVDILLDKAVRSRHGARGVYRCVSKAPYLLVTKQLTLYQTRRMLEKIPWKKFVGHRAPVILIEGVPGCGKTYEIVHTVKKNDLVVTATKSTKEEIAGKVQALGVQGVTVRTIDSFLLNERRHYRRAFIDEGLLVHPGQIDLVAAMSDAKKVYVIGDRKQLNFISRVAQFDVRYRVYSQFSGVEYRNVSYRCPQDVAAKFSHMYDAGFYSTSEVMRSMRVEPITGPNSFAHVPRAKVLCFTQDEKTQLKALGMDVNTIHETQGCTFKDVQLVRFDTKKRPIFDEIPYILVGATRHTNTLTYTTVAAKDAMTELIMSDDCRKFKDLETAKERCRLLNQIALDEEAEKRRMLDGPTRNVPMRKEPAKDWRRKKTGSTKSSETSLESKGLGSSKQSSGPTLKSADLPGSIDTSTKSRQKKRLEKFNKRTVEKKEEPKKEVGNVPKIEMVIDVTDAQIDEQLQSFAGYEEKKQKERLDAPVNISQLLDQAESLLRIRPGPKLFLPKTVMLEKKIKGLKMRDKWWNRSYDARFALGDLQHFYGRCLPEAATTSFLHDEEIFELSDKSFALQDSRFDRSRFGISIDRLSHMAKYMPRLNTGQPQRRVATLKQANEAAAKRTCNAPTYALPIEVETHAMRTIQRLLINFGVPASASMLGTFAATQAVNNREDTYKWIERQETLKQKAILKDEMFELEREVNRYNMMIKTEPKNRLENAAAGEYAAASNIVSHPTVVNAIFGPIMAEMMDRFLSLIKPNILVMIKKDLAAMENHVNSYLDPARAYHKLEVDMSKFDKSQQQEIHHVKMLLLKLLGFDDYLHGLWETSHFHASAVDFLTSLKTKIFLQCKTGDVGTALLNTITSMAVLAGVGGFEGEIVCGYFMGDDSLVYLTKEPNALKITDDLANKYNLSAKALHFQYGYFCSYFFLPCKDWTYVVPDPLKRIERLGKLQLCEDEEDLKIRWEAFSTIILSANWGAAMVPLEIAVAERYKNSDGLADACRALVCAAHDFDVFRGLFEKKPQQITPVDKLEGRIKIVKDKEFHF